eukprot:7692059-Ditylum_brightwellii.AAC.1
MPVQFEFLEDPSMHLFQGGRFYFHTSQQTIWESKYGAMTMPCHDLANAAIPHPRDHNRCNRSCMSVESRTAFWLSPITFCALSHSGPPMGL